MAFEGIDFIKSPAPFRWHENAPAPLFRRKFTVEGPVESAEVRVCGLGYGYFTDAEFTQKYEVSTAKETTVYVKTNFG